MRVTLRAPAHTAAGWDAASPGYAFWIDPSLVVHVGAAAAAAAPRVRATRCHHFAHRYAKPAAEETAKDALTYHAGVLVEFDDGTATLFEVGWRNGLAGFHSRSNWFSAEDAVRIDAAMPPALKLPWRSELLEIRSQDVPFATRAALEAYLLGLSGREAHHRFLDARVTHSADVRVCFRTKGDLLTYALNYAARDPEYHEESRNCQHFAADFFAFLAGTPPIPPHSAVCRVLYRPRPYYFLYPPKMDAGS